MKTFIILIALIVSAMQLSAIAQNCDYNCDYSNSTGWIASQTGTLQSISVSGGTCNFNNVPGNPHDIRIYHTLNSAVGNTWTAEFDWTVTYLGADGGALIPFALTAGTQAPFNPENQGTVQTNQDAIGVLCMTEHYQTTPLWLQPFVKNGNSVIPIPPPSDCRINIQLNTKYRVIISRFSPIVGELKVLKYIPGAPMTLIGKCCFPIPEGSATASGVTGLFTIQSSNLVQADADRRESATMDNLKLTCTVPPCCINPIAGVSSICSSTQQETYSVYNSDNVIYHWSVSCGANFTGQGTSTINITNWGSLTGTGTCTITLVRKCNCETYTTQFVVFYYQDLSPFTGIGISFQTSGNNITPINTVGTPPAPSGAIHWWNIYEAANCDPVSMDILDESNSGGIELRATVFTPNFTVTTPDGSWPPILKNKCYIIKHGLYWPNTPCPWTEKRIKILIAGGKIISKLGDAVISKDPIYRQRMMSNSAATKK